MKENRQYDLLRILENAVNESDKKRGKLHEVWEDSFDWKVCIDRKFLLQKLNYIHLNPCRGKWMLAENPFEYDHSSARFYITGEQGKYEVLNFEALHDIHLSIRSWCAASPATARLGVGARLRSVPCFKPIRFAYHLACPANLIGFPPLIAVTVI